ncbi:hypothetical protein Plhal304r1_c009g0035551 [Plasmopara halstedii]
MFNVRSFRILCSELLKTHDKAIDRATRGKPSAKKVRRDKQSIDQTKRFGIPTTIWIH